MKTEKFSSLDVLKKHGISTEKVEESYATRKSILDIAEKIRSLRKEFGITQKELAEKTGMAQPDISKIEAGIGDKGPTIDTIDRIARAFDRSLSVNFEPKNSLTDFEKTNIEFTELNLKELNLKESIEKTLFEKLQDLESITKLGINPPGGEKLRKAISELNKESPEKTLFEKLFGPESINALEKHSLDVAKLRRSISELADERGLTGDAEKKKIG